MEDGRPTRQHERDARAYIEMEILSCSRLTTLAWR